MTELEAKLRDAAARVLRLPAARIARGTPLARYGLDSLNSMELALAVSDIAGREFSDELLVDCPSIAAIADHLNGSAQRGCVLGMMRADAVLPNDIAPSGSREMGKAILVTGATGFLGSHLVTALLQETSHEILCLVRAPDDATAQARLGAACGRVRAVAGDIERPRLGTTRGRYADLQARVGSVFHCAAAVDWSLGYESLRKANVHATLELLRFASRGPRKAFHYVSSATTCYSTRAPRRVREADSPVDPAGIHLGYAQSKWVAEALVRAAGGRGLEVAIYRPALIAGHSVTGAGNNEDFLASLIKGCIALGAAPDLQWRMDACPVDFVAGAIARLSQSKGSMVHLVNPRRAGWLEAVLWMNLRGYKVRTLPFERWIEQVESQSCSPQHPLHRLRGFLLNRPGGEGGRYLPELYAQEHLGVLDDAATRERLGAAGLECPRLEPRLLEKWFDAYERSGFLTPRSTHRSRAAPPPDIGRQLEDVLGLRVAAARRFEIGGESSILGELASWHAGSALALGGYRINEDFSVVVKPKLDDDTVLEVACEVARLCDPQLGAAFAAHCRRTSFAGTARREIALYESRNVALRAHSPRCHGVIRSGNQQALVLEHVADLQLNDALARWQPRHIEAAIEGIAEVHAEDIPSGVGPALEPSTPELWIALADHAQPWISAWTGVSLARMARDSAQRTRALEQLPRALIHHDFNPRNIGLRPQGGKLQLCALDWELATVGVPQRDLAELLCFVLTPDASVEAVRHYVEYHRSRLAQGLDRELWIDGFRLALEDFAVQRLTMYFMAHRFRPQPFLERVVRTWARLSAVASSLKELEHAAA